MSDERGPWLTTAAFVGRPFQELIHIKLDGDVHVTKPLSVRYGGQKGLADQEKACQHLIWQSGQIRSGSVGSQPQARDKDPERGLERQAVV